MIYMIYKLYRMLDDNVLQRRPEHMWSCISYTECHMNLTMWRAPYETLQIKPIPFERISNAIWLVSYILRRLRCVVINFKTNDICNNKNSSGPPRPFVKTKIAFRKTECWILDPLSAVFSKSLLKTILWFFIKFYFKPMK